jgi:hypothetical protein
MEFGRCKERMVREKERKMEGNGEVHGENGKGKGA